jgi:class 3 adenylate cyclase
MRSDEIAPWFALSKHNNEVATLDLSPEDEPTLFKPPVIQTKVPFTQSVSPTGTDLLDLAELHPSAELNEFALEPAHPCQAAWNAFEHSRYLLAVVHPFLSLTTWTEAVEVVRRGGRVLPTETYEVSILWLDIASFTKIIDKHPLDEVIPALNTYLDTLTQLVYCHGGDVSKYLGDGFLSVFANADDAVETGCAIQRAAADFNCRQSARGEMVFPTRVGIDTGQITIVSLGSHNRQDRTVVGMPVNLAKRLQEQALPEQVWLSQATFNQLRDQSDCRYLGLVRVKGRQEPVRVYEKRWREW